MRRGLGKGSDLDEDIASLVATLESEHELSAHNENWLVSYADMMTLLFGFFAMLYLLNGNLQRVNQATPPPPKQEQAAATPAPPQVQAETQEQQLAAKVRSRKEGGAGGNRGFFFVEYMPPELMIALSIAAFLHYLLYRFGERRRRLELLIPKEEEMGLQPPPLRVRPALPPTGAVLDDSEIFGEVGEEDEVEGHGDPAIALTDERWLISYADLMTLLFGFFAMLYLMGPNFDAVKKAMENTFASDAPPTAAGEKTPDSVAVPVAISSESLKDLFTPPAPVAPPPPVATATSLAPPAAPTTPVPPAPPPVTPPVASAAPEQPQAKPAPTVSLEEMEERQWKALHERLSKTKGERASVDKAGAGLGGGGSGGGRGKDLGSGAHSGGGSTICDSGSSIPYQPNCSGVGYFGCLDPESIYGVGGQNGDGGALEFFCIGGRTRICLTWERCPWRPGSDEPLDFPDGLQKTNANPDTMTCSPYGLPLSGGGGATRLAACKTAANCGFSTLECDSNGQLTAH